MNIVLLRGLARESGHWLDFPSHLQKTLMPLDKHFNILTPDVKGAGVFFEQEADTNIAEMTKHIRTQVNSRNENKKHILVGLSMGGMLALHWAKHFTEEIAGIVLINSSLGDQNIRHRLRLSAWPAALKSIFLSTAKRERIMLSKVSNKQDNEASYDQWLEIQNLHPVSNSNALRMLYAAKSFKLEKFPNIPGLVLTSKADRLVSYHCSLDIAKRSHWPIQIHSSAGHDLPLDDPEWVCSEIGIWLKKLIDKNHSCTSATPDTVHLKKEIFS